MRKVIYLLVVLVVAVIGKDSILHYNVYRNINAYLSENSSDIKSDQILLKLWPLGGAHIRLLNTEIDKDSIKLQVKEVMLRNPLLSFNHLTIKADQVVVNDVMTIHSVQGVIDQHQENGQAVLGIKQGLIANARLSLDRINLAADQLLVHGRFMSATKALQLDGQIPALRINDLEGTSLTTLVDLNLTHPVDGRIDLRMKGVDDLLQALVNAQLVKPKELSLLQLGARLFANANEEIPLTLKFSNNHIFLGPVKLQ